MTFKTSVRADGFAGFSTVGIKSDFVSSYRTTTDSHYVKHNTVWIWSILLKLFILQKLLQKRRR